MNSAANAGRQKKPHLNLQRSISSSFYSVDTVEYRPHHGGPANYVVPMIDENADDPTHKPCTESHSESDGSDFERFSIGGRRDSYSSYSSSDRVCKDWNVSSKESCIDAPSIASIDSRSIPVKRSYTSVWLIVVTAAMTYTLHGFSNSVTNGMLTLGTFLHRFPEIDTEHTSGHIKAHNSTIQGVAVGVYQIGCAAGALACYFLSDRIGRKRIIHILGILSCIGVLLQATAYSLPHLIVGRVILGIGIGAGHATFPLYLSECVTPRIRGRAIIACASAGNFGHFVGAAVEIAFFFLKRTEAQWRVPVALEIVWAGAGAVLPFWCPETPRFLLRKGKREDAFRSQSLLCGMPRDSSVVLDEIKLLDHALHIANSDGNPHKKRHAKKWYRAGLAVFIQIMSSMSGIDVVSFFSTQTFEAQLHFSPLTSRYLTMGLQGAQWLSSSLSILMIDSMGRRPLLLGSAAGMAVAMAFLAGLTPPSATSVMLDVSILFYFLVMWSYPVGYHLIPSMYAAELSPDDLRHQITALSGCVHFLFDFTVTLVTPVAFEAISSSYYIVFVITNAVTFTVVYFCFPETKYLELERIEEIFETAGSWRSLISFNRHSKRRCSRTGVNCEKKV